TGRTRNCSPIGPSSGVPTGGRRTPGAAARSVTVPAESRDGLRSHRASPGYGSARPAHRAQAPGSPSPDGSPAPAPRARRTKTARPDPQMRPACQPPPIRDRKIESRHTRYGEGLFSRLLESRLQLKVIFVALAQ